MKKLLLMIAISSILLAGCSISDAEKITKESPAYYDKVKDYRSFEGVMLPGKYKVYEGDTLSRFRTDCLKDFNKTVNQLFTMAL